MNLGELLEIIKLWDNLGGSVQGQLNDIVLNGEDLEDQNENALQYILNDFLEELPEDIADVNFMKENISDYLNRDKSLDKDE